MMLLDNRSIKTIASWFVVSASLVACGGKTSGADDTTGSSAGDGDVTTASSGGDGDVNDTAGDGDGDATGDGDGDATTEPGDGDSTTGGDGDSTTGGDIDPMAACDVEGELGSVDCNTCTCQDGRWLCTEIACGVSCDPADYPQDDGCNSCSCVDNYLVCTDVYCPELCAEYDTKLADDGCNTCTCSGGLWACTKKACGLTACGARAGETCSADEYCAYEAGELCGAADAESVCKVRPELCTAHVAMVCGCDGKSYSNDCVAASAGTGVMHDGACESEQK